MTQNHAVEHNPKKMPKCILPSFYFDYEFLIKIMKA